MKKPADKEEGKQMFHHARNIEVGRGRILWGTATEVKNTYGITLRLPEGWVLPGGARTKDPNVALMRANWINETSRR